MSRLVWGVKQSFRAYVQATGGTIAAGDGAQASETGEIAFPAQPGGTLASGADGVLTGRAAFLGSVRFEAHGGMLSVRLADPAVEIGPDGAVLTVADLSAGARRLAIASLDAAGAARGEAGEVALPARVTMDGSFVLGDHYPPGTELDPVRVWVG